MSRKLIFLFLTTLLIFNELIESSSTGYHHQWHECSNVLSMLNIVICYEKQPYAHARELTFTIDTLQMIETKVSLWAPRIKLLQSSVILSFLGWSSQPFYSFVDFLNNPLARQAPLGQWHPNKQSLNPSPKHVTIRTLCWVIASSRKSCY